MANDKRKLRFVGVVKFMNQKVKKLYFYLYVFREKLDCKIWYARNVRKNKISFAKNTCLFFRHFEGIWF